MYFVVKVSDFMNRTRLDGNGNPAVYLESQNGSLPKSVRVLSGTIANQKGLEVGNFYILKVIDTQRKIFEVRPFPEQITQEE
jgi:hypothetical protein